MDEKGLEAEASLKTAVAPELSRPEDKSNTLDTSRALISPSPLVSAETFCLFVGDVFKPDDISKTSETSKALMMESVWLSVNLYEAV